MSLEEEREKYILIKEDLLNYRKSLDQETKIIRALSDHDLAVALDDLNERRKYQFDKNKSRPYFAKIVFKKEGEDKTTTAYIGRIGFASLNNEDIIIDWRAPISDLYYNSKLGKASFKIDKEEIKGELELKRQINFEDGQITSVYDLDNSISSDEFLQPYLSASADNRLKNIIATIQKEQDDIIRMPFNDNLIIQGVAGSGKTTVALHRLSYLIYNNRSFIKPYNYMVISPNSIFKSYISSLLEELDADQVNSLSLDDLLEHVLQSNFKILKKHEQYEYLCNKKIKFDYLKFKGSLDFQKAIDKFLVSYAKEMFCKDFNILNVKIFDKEFIYKKFKECDRESLEEQANILAGTLDSYAKDNDQIEDYLRNLYNKDLLSFQDKITIERTLQKGIKSLIYKFYKKRPLLEIYKKFINEVEKYTEFNDFKILKGETLKNLKSNIISYDDIGAILYIATKIRPLTDFLEIKQIVIDEAQDFSYLTFKALKDIFKYANFSIFGDLAQGIYSYQSIKNWNEIIPLFNNLSYLELNKSYRTTIEITQEANKILNKLGLHNAENVLRHGEPVQIRISKNIKKTIEAEIEEFKKSNFISCAIICKDQEELKCAYELLKDNVSIYNESDNEFNMNSVCLLTVESAKGLEFDFVIIYDFSSYAENELDFKRFYVAKTRALHKLILNQIE